MDTKYQPASIELDVKNDLTIEWYDGHKSRLLLDLLRKECPCAGCNAKRLEDEEKAKDPKVSAFNVLSGTIVTKAEALNMESVGNYAVKFDWNDNHNSGIYTFQFLRDLCPCDECNG